MQTIKIKSAVRCGGFRYNHSHTSRVCQSPVVIECEPHSHTTLPQGSQLPQAKGETHMKTMKIKSAVRCGGFRHNHNHSLMVRPWQFGIEFEAHSHTTYPEGSRSPQANGDTRVKTMKIKSAVRCGGFRWNHSHTAKPR